jgi:hypothetical protein
MTELQALNKEMGQSGATGSLRQAIVATLKQLRSRWTFRYTSAGKYREGVRPLHTSAQEADMRASYASAIAIALGALFVVPHAFAHHSFAPHFDSSKPVNISGTITEFEARNPHSYLHIAATDENGRTREYVCESHGVTQLSRNGIKADMLKAGTKVRVTGSLSRHSAYMCFFDNVEFADGRTLNVNGPRGAAAAGPAAAPALPARKDIFGTWLLAPIPNRSTSGPQPMIQSLTPAGEKAVACVRSVQGRPDVPLRSRRDSPSLGRTGHSPRDRP